MKAELKTKTFRGRSMADALEQVKRQFGRHAVILTTRTVRRGSLFGVGKRETVEITAARSLSDLPGELRRGGIPVSRHAMAPAGQDNNGHAVPPRSGNAAGDSVLLELTQLKSMVAELVKDARRPRTPEVPFALHDTYLNLIQAEVAEQLAARLIQDVQEQLSQEQLNDPGAVRACLAAAVESMLPTAGPIRRAASEGPTLIALVGPTGVGKTTTIAKLAADLRLREQRRVGLITLDTYRIAAVAQLKTYAEIIETPLEVVMAPDQLRDAVHRLSDQEIILIDTAGRSQRDAMKVKELQRFFAVVRPHEVHLVLSTSTTESVLHETVERFQGVGIDRVIFTKLDEAVGFGVMLSCLGKAGARLSYVTTGQNVPHDITVANGSTLAGMILGSAVLREE